MSLKKAIMRATKDAMAAQGSVAKKIIFYQAGNVNYDTNTGTVTRTVTATIPIKEAYFTSYKEKDIDGTNVQAKDQRLTIFGPDLALRPKLYDWVVDENGTQWEVILGKFPPPGAVHILQVRSP